MSASKVITYNGQSIYSAEGLRLMPGRNVVDEAVPGVKGRLKKFLANPGVKQRIESGAIVLGDEAADIGEKTVPEVVADIDATFDRDLLRAMLKDEKAGANRKGVIEPLEKKIAEIEKGE